MPFRSALPLLLAALAAALLLSYSPLSAASVNGAPESLTVVAPEPPPPPAPEPAPSPKPAPQGHPVAIGRPGSETPTGRFAVTDKLQGSRFGPYYGCCVLALNGHQPKLPSGWPGGNRLAIHGTNVPGAAASAGCLRAADPDLELLMRRVPLGTPVFIRN